MLHRLKGETVWLLERVFDSLKVGSINAWEIKNVILLI